MWIHTNYGFFSVVKNHSKHSSLEFVIRARVREHLEDTHIFNEIVELEPCDYQYRMYVTKSQLVDWLLSVVDNIDYDNFKDSIKDQQLKEFCSNVWVAGVYRDWETDRKSTRLNSSHITRSRMPSSA